VHVWYLRRYSADLSPIKLWFSEVEALLRAARRRSE
jgi:hypothetical protein